MVFKSNELLSELEDYVKSHIGFVEGLHKVTESKLQVKINTETWSVLECIEHLNLYASFYNQEIENRISISNSKSSLIFKSGFLGNKFALDMLPKEGMKTMKTFKSKNPIHSDLNKNIVLSNFIYNQQKLLDLIEISKSKDLAKVKTAITLPLLKFRLGDTFRFVIYHNERHIVQVKNIMT